MTELTVPQSRIEVPLSGNVLLEVVHQPLYSAAAFAAASLPFSVELFSYRIGTNVPGAGAGVVASTINHTNMTQAGTLAKPKVCEFRQIREVVSMLDAALTTPVTGTAGTAAASLSNLWDLVQLFFWGSTVRFHVGEKDYLEGVPAFLVPGNVGIGGISSVSADDQATAQRQQVVCPNGAGRVFDLEPYAVFLPSQQQFFAEIRSPQLAVNRPVLPAEAIVYLIADAVVGREVM